MIRKTTPRSTVTAIARMNAGPIVAPDRPHGELAGDRAQDQQDRRRPDERAGSTSSNGCPVSSVDRRPGSGVRPHAEVGREQPGEEHHLRGDEQEHPEDRVADPAAGVVRQLGDRAVLVRGVAGSSVVSRHRSVVAQCVSRPAVAEVEQRVAPSGSPGAGRSCTAAAGTWSPIRACWPPTGRRRPARRCAAR